jgi:hypothetical protein
VVAFRRVPFASRIWRVALLRNRGSGSSSMIVISTRLRGSAALQGSQVRANLICLFFQSWLRR